MSRAFLKFSGEILADLLGQSGEGSFGKYPQNKENGAPRWHRNLLKEEEENEKVNLFYDLIISCVC